MLMWSGYKDLMKRKGKMPKWSSNIENDIDWSAIKDEKLQSYLPDQKNKASMRYRILTFTSIKKSGEIIEFIVANPERAEKAKRNQV